MTPSERKIDRTGWPPGPWDEEPDELSWTTRAGLAGHICRNNLGALCGYVAVPAEHPAFEKDYDSVYKVPGLDELSVHGGLTYARDRRPMGEPEPGRWWLGFDCVHFGDMAPRELVLERDIFIPAGLPQRARGAYRTLAYVREECEQLAEQLAAAKAP